MNRIFKVTCPKSWGEHVGVYVEAWGLVFHNSPGKGEHLSPLEEFGPRDRIKAVEITGIAPELVVARINQILSHPGTYSITANNCDHSYNKVVVGRAESPQLQSVGKSLAMFGLLVVVLAAFSKS